MPLVSGKDNRSVHPLLCSPGVTHLSIGVIIYPGGSSVRHPKGARSIGIGHPRSGDRCTVTRPYPLDPLRVAEQKSSFPVTRKGSRSNACAYCTSTLEVTKSKETHFCSGKDMKRHLETLRDNSSWWGCYICTVGANRKGRSHFSCKFVTLSSRGVAPKTRGFVIACDPATP